MTPDPVHGHTALLGVFGMLGIGLMSVEHGLWYARSAELTQQGILDIFSTSILALGWLVVGLKTGWSLTGREEPYLAEPMEPVLGAAPRTRRPQNARAPSPRVGTAPRSAQARSGE